MLRKLATGALLVLMCCDPKDPDAELREHAADRAYYEKYYQERMSVAELVNVPAGIKCYVALDRVGGEHGAPSTPSAPARSSSLRHTESH